MTEGTRTAISLGSNLGDREAALADAVSVLRRQLHGIRVSSVYQTSPLHFEAQPEFMNACCTGVTRLTPRQLLSQLQDAERAAGRDRSGPRYGPRTLDLDLLLYGDAVLETPELVIPHPRLRERAFVLVPLNEIASDWIVPASRGAPAASVAELAAAAGTDGIRHIGDLHE